MLSIQFGGVEVRSFDFSKVLRDAAGGAQMHRSLLGRAVHGAQTLYMPGPILSQQGLRFIHRRLRMSQYKLLHRICLLPLGAETCPFEELRFEA